MTEQELLEELEKSIESNNRNNLDLIKVLNGTDTQDVTLQDGSVVPSLSKRVQAEVVEDSNYLFKSDNLASVEDKQSARTNLGVPSVTEMNTAITTATPNATESVLGKAKIATTTIAQEGLNDTDIITAKKLNAVLLAQSQKRSWVDVTSARTVNTWYQNTTGYDIDIHLIRNGQNVASTIITRKIGTTSEFSLSGVAIGNNLLAGSVNNTSIPSGWEYKFEGITTVLELRV